MQVNKVSFSTKGIQFPKLDSVTAVDRCIDTAIANAKTLKDQIQVAGIAIGMWAGKHGDKPTACKQATRLVLGVEHGMKAEALIAWFVDLFGFVVGDVDITQGDRTGETVKGFVDLDLKFLKENFNTKNSPKLIHWVSYAPPTNWTGFDLDKKLESILKGAKDAIKRVDDAAKDGEDLSGKVSIDTGKLEAFKLFMSLPECQLHSFLAQAQETKVETFEEVGDSDSVTETDGPESVAA